MKYRADIDGLRAIAVLSVLIFHAFPKTLAGGFVGVDIFFVISGYLISSILFKEISENRFSYLEFYKRRAKRIFPALILVFFMVLLLGWFVLLSGEYALLGKHVLTSTFFVQNIILIKEAGYFDLVSDLKPLLHLWSLSVEEQFYLLWPLAIGIAFRKRWNFIMIIVTAMFLSFLMNILRVVDFPTSTFYGPQARFWELMVGAWVSYRVYQKKETLIQSSVPSILGLAGIAISIFYINGETLFPGWWATVPVIGSALIIASSPQSFINRLISNRVLVWVGLISYPLYLWHWPLLSFARILSPDTFLGNEHSVVIKLGCLFISFLLAYLTYAFIEKRIRTQFLPRIALILTGLLFLSGCVGGYIFFKNGFPVRAAAERPIAKLKHLDVANPMIGICPPDVTFNTVEWCKTNSSTHSPDVVVIGDSHALTYSNEIADYFKKQNRFTYAFGTGDSLGLYNAGSHVGGGVSVGGIRSINAAFDWAIANHAKTLFLISRGPIFFNSTYSKKIRVHDLAHADTKLISAIYESVLDQTLSKLQEAHIQTYFVYDNADLGFDPMQSCFQRPVDLLNSGKLAVCGIQRDRVMNWQKEYRESVTRVLQKYPEVKTFDPEPYLCDASYCYAMKDDVLLYHDSNHLSEDGVAFLAKYFNF